MRVAGNGAWDASPDLKGDQVINPNAMLVTPKHVLAGSLENGLLIYDRSTGRWHTVQDGLPSPNVTALAASGNTIWIGTDNGLVKIPEDNSNDPPLVAGSFACQPPTPLPTPTPTPIPLPPRPPPPHPPH